MESQNVSLFNQVVKQTPLSLLTHANIHLTAFIQRAFSIATAPAPALPPALVDPLQTPDYFSLRDMISVEQLFKFRAHLGHKSLLRNPYMTPYLFGTRQGIDILDLEQTAELFFDALNFTAHMAYRGGIILFMIQHQQVCLTIFQISYHN